MDDFKAISVVQEMVGGKKRLKIHNPTSYPVIGVGAQGAVFRLSAERCVKVYADPENVVWERKALEAARGDSFLPKLYKAGERYVVMEYIQGPTLEEFLADRGKYTEDISRQLLEIIKEMRRMKFNRIDTRLAHIIVSPSGKLKVIDHIGAYRSHRRVPLMLFKSLDKAGVLKSFLQYVVANDLKLYMKWQDRMKADKDVEGVPDLPNPKRLK
jgi:predicted Ser/Thr protein kinase